MEVYQQLFKPRSEEHNKKVHIQKINSKEEILDLSCITCNPVQSKPRADFWNFWQ